MFDCSHKKQNGFSVLFFILLASRKKSRDVYAHPGSFRLSNAQITRF